MEYVTPGRMKELESLASSYGLGVGDLMENAGRAVAETIDGRYGGTYGRRVLVVCGSGNNGGDGFVAARYLSGLGWKVRVVLLSDPSGIRTAEARKNWERLAPPVEVHTALDAPEVAAHGAWMESPGMIVDAILGTGVRAEVREPVLTAINLINLSGATKVALDIPSGLDPATGETRGPAVKADLTVALHAAKSGLRGNQRYTGELIAVPIGIEERSER